MSLSPFAGIKTLSTAIRTRQISSVELTKIYLTRLKTLGDAHNAVAELTEEHALEQARKADGQSPRSILHGIPYGAKDLLATAGIPTRWGSPGHEDQVFDFNATCVERLQEAGAVLVAKLEMIEMAGGGNYDQADASRSGPCLNAWDRELWAGGSSSGSGAAVALGCVPYALGSETSGSITCPSAFNGCTGFRPTYGRVSRYGAMPLCWTLDKIGPMGTSAEDVAVVLKAIAGEDPRDPSTITEALSLEPRANKPRIGLLKEEFESNLATDCERSYHAVVDVLRTLGYETVDVSLPILPYSLAVSLIVDAEGSSAHEHFIRSEKIGLLRDPHQIAGFTTALETKAVDYLWAMRLRREALKANAIWDACDCIFMPVFYHKAISAKLPFEETWVNMGVHLDPSNLLGWPAMAFPIGFEDGAPLGGQIIAPAFREDVCFEVVRDYQRNSEFHLAHPAASLA